MQRAVERGLEIISEATRHIPDDYKALAPEIPWPQIAAIGNLLRHEYQRADNSAIWNIVTFAGFGTGGGSLGRNRQHSRSTVISASEPSRSALSAGLAQAFEQMCGSSERRYSSRLRTIRSNAAGAIVVACARHFRFVGSPELAERREEARCKSRALRGTTETDVASVDGIVPPEKAHSRSESVFARWAPIFEAVTLRSDSRPAGHGPAICVRSISRATAPDQPRGPRQRSIVRGSSAQVL